VPEKYFSTVVWTCNRPNLADNVRRVVADVPGFMFLKSRLYDESKNEVEESEHAGMKDGVNGQLSSDTSVKFGEKSSVSPSTNVNIDFRPDMPYNGANKIAFESHFMRHTIWKNSFLNKGTEKRPSSAKSKPKKLKKSVKEKSRVTQKYKKYSRKSTGTSKKKATKRTRLTKRKAYTKSKKGSKKNRRRR